MRSESVKIAVDESDSTAVHTKKSKFGVISFVMLALIVVTGTVLVVSDSGLGQIHRTIMNLKVDSIKKVVTSETMKVVEPKFVTHDTGFGAIAVVPVGDIKEAVNPSTAVRHISKAAAPTVVVTYAGNGNDMSPVDETIATLTPAGRPRDILFDSSNNMYYTESNSNTVRLVSATSGKTFTFVGTWGSAGSSGDGGPATSSTINNPFGLNWDANGDMLLSDNSNHVIRRIDMSSGIINRVAGTGAAGYTGDQLYSTASALNNPWNAVSDASNNVFISDWTNCRIRKVLASNSIMVNFAGTGTCNAGTDGLPALSSNFYNLGKIIFNPTYTFLYVPEWNAHRIRRINMATGYVNVYAGITNTAGYIGDGMAATSSRLYYPREVTMDAAGTGVYIADHYNHIIRYVDSTGLISTSFGIPSAPGFNQDGLSPTITNIYYPESCALDNYGNLIVADLSNYRIRGAFVNNPTPSPTRSPTKSTATFVQTIAGNGNDGYAVDGYLAINTPVGYAHDLIFDSSSNLYYSDEKTSTVRVIYAATGKTMTYAGTYRNAGSTGDNGPALKATFGAPFGLNWDLSGNLLVTDTSYHNVRKITVSSGIVSKVAGTFTNGYTGEGMYATGSALYTPVTAAVDASGNIFIADWNNCRIRKVLATTSYMYTFGGTGSCSSGNDGSFIWNSPIYYVGKLAFGPSYTYMYFPEWSSHRVRRVTMSTGIVTTVGGQKNSYAYSGDGGLAINGYFYYPRAVKVDSLGGLYITDWSNHAVRYISASGILTTVAGGNGAGFNQDGLDPTDTRLYNPESAMLSPAGFLTILDYNNLRIRGVYPKVPTGVPTRSPTVGVSLYIQTVVGTGANANPIEGLVATATPAGTPRDILFDSFNHMYYSDDSTNTIRVVNATTGISRSFAGSYKIAGYGGDNGPATAALMGAPYVMSWDKDGNMVFSDLTYHVVRKIVMTTKYISKVAGIPGSAGYSGDAIIATNSMLNNPWGVAADSNGNYYISDHTNCRIRKVTSTGVTGYMYNFGGTGTCSAGDDGLAAINTNLYYPLRSTTDSARLNLFYCEWSSHRVRKINFATTIITTVAGITNSAGYTGDGGLAVNARLYYPRSVKVDASGGLYIADHYNHAVRYISAEGLISTYAGGNGAGFTQDGLDPTAVKLYYPEATATDKNGNVYIADTTNYRIRGVFSKVPTFLPTRVPTSNPKLYTIRTIAGTGADNWPVDEAPAVTTSPGYSNSIIFDANNNLFYTDSKSFTVRVIYASTGLAYTFAGTYRSQGNSGDRDAATSALMNNPFHISWDRNGNMLVTDYGAHVVRIIDMSALTISRVAGTGGAGYSGEQLSATTSSLNTPWGAINDGSNNVLIADYNNCRIRKVSATIMNTYAGTGSCGNSVDGIQASNAALNYVSRMTYDTGFNNLYFIEYVGHRVRKFNIASGVLTTAVGMAGSYGYSGDGGLAISAQLYYPRDLIFDRVGGLFIPEWSNSAIRYVTKEGIISTFAGGIGGGFNQDNLIPQSTKLNNPTCVALDKNGFLVFCDYNNMRIRGAYSSAPTSTPTRFPTKNYQVSTMITAVGTGAAGVPTDGLNGLNTPAGGPLDMTFDSAGNMYYGCDRSYTVRVVYAATGNTFTFAGTSGVSGNTGNGGAATSAKLNGAIGVNWDNNKNMLITDYGFHTVRRVTMSTKVITLLAGTQAAGYTGEAFPGTSSALNQPHGTSADLNGNLYITDHLNCRVRRLLNADQKLYTFAGTGTCSSSADGLQATASNLYYAIKQAFNPDYSYLFFNEWTSHRVRKIHMTTGIISTVAGITNSAGWSGDGGLATNAQLYYPRHINFDSYGGFYLAEWYNYDVRYISAEGIITTVAGVPGSAGYNQDGISPLQCKLNLPQGTAFDPSGNLFIVDYGNYRIRKIVVTAAPSSAPTVASS